MRNVSQNSVEKIKTQV